MEETETTLELEMQIKFSVCPGEGMTRHSPGFPAHIEHMIINIEGEPISPELEAKIVIKFEDEIDEACWDHVQECAAENAIIQAEHRRDSREDR